MQVYQKRKKNMQSQFCVHKTYPANTIDEGLPQVCLLSLRQTFTIQTSIFAESCRSKELHLEVSAYAAGFIPPSFLKHSFLYFNLMCGTSNSVGTISESQPEPFRIRFLFFGSYIYVRGTHYSPVIRER